MALRAGAPAPDVTATVQHGESVAPDFADPTVVYFYPRDGTPGCTLEAREFEADIESFRRAGVPVYGVSTGDVDSHREFADDEGLSFDLLADPDGDVAEAFGLEVQNDFVDRITDEAQAVGDADTMRPGGHAVEVLDEAETLDQKPGATAPSIVASTVPAAEPPDAEESPPPQPSVRS